MQLAPGARFSQVLKSFTPKFVLLETVGEQSFNVMEVELSTVIVKGPEESPAATVGKTPAFGEKVTEPAAWASGERRARKRTAPGMPDKSLVMKRTWCSMTERMVVILPSEHDCRKPGRSQGIPQQQEVEGKFEGNRYRDQWICQGPMFAIWEWDSKKVSWESMGSATTVTTPVAPCVAFPRSLNHASCMICMRPKQCFVRSRSPASRWPTHPAPACQCNTHLGSCLAVSFTKSCILHELTESNMTFTHVRLGRKIHFSPLRGQQSPPSYRIKNKNHSRLGTTSQQADASRLCRVLRGQEVRRRSKAGMTLFIDLT